MLSWWSFSSEMWALFPFGFSICPPFTFCQHIRRCNVYLVCSKKVSIHCSSRPSAASNVSTLQNETTAQHAPGKHWVMARVPHGQVDRWWQHSPAGGGTHRPGCLAQAQSPGAWPYRSGRPALPNTKAERNAANWEMISPSLDRFLQLWWKKCQVLCFAINYI